MSTIWLGVVCLAGWWISVSRDFPSTERWPWEWALAGLLLCQLARGHVARTQIHVRTTIGLAGLLGVVAVFIPVAEFRAVVLVLAGAYVASAVLSRHRRMEWVSAGALTAAAILVFQGLGVVVYSVLAHRLHALGAAGVSVVAFVLRLLGVSAAERAGQLLLAEPDGAVSLELGWEHAGLLMLLLVAMAAIPVACLHARRPLSLLGRILLILGAYSLARLVVLTAVYSVMPFGRIFWSPTAQIVSFLPLGIILGRLFRPDLPARSLALARVDFPGWMRIGGAAAASLAAVALIVFAVTFADPGVKKQGRVVVDEGHSDWEWSDEPLGIEKYGLRSTYSFTSMFDHLAKIWRVDRTREQLTPASLSNVDVLVLKMPTSPYSDTEVEAVVAFVEAGGGLWLIGDHTDVFGSSTYLNAVSERFGIQFCFDYVFDLGTGGLDVYRRPPVAPHPVVRHVPPFMFATGCSLSTSLACDSVMTGVRLGSLRGDYSQKNFFPVPGPRESLRFGSFCQMASRLHGRGRVLAFSDSTSFSSFFFFMPGKVELALGSVDWLNRTNAWSWANQVASWLGLLAAGVAILVLRRLPVSFALAAVVGGAITGGTAALHVSDALGAAAYPTVEVEGERRWVGFDLAHSGIFLPIERLQSPVDIDYSTFFVWTQRLGYTPVACDGLDACLDRTGMIVLAEPGHAPSDVQLRALRDYVERGGGLLVLFREGAGSAAGRRILDVMGGIEIGSGAVEETRLAHPHSGVSIQEWVEVLGGTPLVHTQGGSIVAAMESVGDGRVVACGISGVLHASHMGTTGSVPTPEQLATYTLAYLLLRKAMGDEQPASDAR